MKPIDRTGAADGNDRARRAVLTLLAVPFYAPAWVAGKLVSAALWARDAIVAGYKHGRGSNEL